MTAVLSSLGLAYRFEVQQRQQYTQPRGAGAERKGGRNGGTFHGERWVQRAVTNDEAAAHEYVQGLGEDWRVLDNATGSAA